MAITPRSALRLRVLPKLPARLTASGGLAVNKTNGVWTFSPDWDELAQQSIVDSSIHEVWIRNTQTGAYARATVAALFSSIYVGGVRIITSSNTADVTPSDTAIIFNNSSSAARTVNLPLVSARGGLPLLIADFRGNGNITVNPQGSDLIMLKSSPDASWLIVSDGGAGMGGSMRLLPVDGVGWINNTM